MYGWFATGWALNKNIPLFSKLAKRAENADIVIGVPDEDWWIRAGTILFGIFGL